MSFAAWGNICHLCINSAPVWTLSNICTPLLSVILELCYSQILTSSTFISTNCSEASRAHAQLYFFLLIIFLTPAGSQPARLSWEIASNDFPRTIYTELFKEDISLNTNQWTSLSRYRAMQPLAPLARRSAEPATMPSLHISQGIGFPYENQAAFALGSLKPLQSTLGVFFSHITSSDHMIAIEFRV